MVFTVLASLARRSWGRGLLIVLAIFVWTVGNRYAAVQIARADWQVELALEREAALRDAMERANDIMREGLERAERTEQDFERIEKVQDNVISIIRESDATCVISDDILDRLLDLE